MRNGIKLYQKILPQYIPYSFSKSNGAVFDLK